MEYNVGQKLRVDGETYEITGKITYTARWSEYCLRSLATGKEKWLSCDDNYREYSISQKTKSRVSFSGYHIVDEGVQEVLSASGNVDVERGDKAVYKEYEDVTEEKIISVETWEDEEEISTGYYLDLDEIQLMRDDYGTFASSDYNSGGSNTGGSKAGKLIIAILILLAVIFGLKGVFDLISSKNSIAAYLSSSSAYEYTTSITGTGKEKADVYVTQYTIDQAARDIIDAIEGKTESVQQNTEDGDTSVAILTSKEYCIIYTSEDGETLVQISARKYAYRNNHSLYRANRYSNRYYRRFYYSRGYSSDRNTYGNDSSPYSTYSEDTINTNTNDTYDTYSSSVRQSSVSTRTSSGGGLSSGK